MPTASERIRAAREALTHAVEIVGVVDGRGYLCCSECIDVTDYDSGYVWGDSSPHNEEACDICGEALNRHLV